MPVNRDNRWVPPAPGTMANDVSGNPNTELCSLAMRMSAASANSSPPPNAAPSIAAMIGMGNCDKRWKVSRSAVTKISAWGNVIWDRSFKSAPAEKTRYETDVKMRQRVAVFVGDDSDDNGGCNCCSICSIYSCSSCII